MKCPQCKSTNVSVHRGNRNRVWCRACGNHFDCDFEMECFKASVTTLLEAVERLIEAQKPTGPPACYVPGCVGRCPGKKGRC